MWNVKCENKNEGPKIHYFALTLYTGASKLFRWASKSGSQGVEGRASAPPRSASVIPERKWKWKHTNFQHILSEFYNRSQKSIPIAPAGNFEEHFFSNKYSHIIWTCQDSGSAVTKSCENKTGWWFNGWFKRAWPVTVLLSTNDFDHIVTEGGSDWCVIY